MKATLVSVKGEYVDKLLLIICNITSFKKGGFEKTPQVILHQVAPNNDAKPSVNYFDQSMASKDQKSSGILGRIAPTGEAKPFNCSKCKSRGFKTIGAKMRHDREEHGPNKFKCAYCGHTVKRQYQIVQHIEEAHPERTDTYLVPSRER
jgi:hypothetical protein